MKPALQTQQEVQQYYSEVLETSQDLKTSACCDLQAMPERLKSILSDIDEEILSKFYGCGSPLPQELRGVSVLDLGCGSGRDAYILSKLVGKNGTVVGVDRTAEQLDVAIRHQDSQTAKFGYRHPNVEFHLGNIEDLQGIGLEDNSLDLVVSNCVINLSPHKDKVFQEIFRVLKPGGELYFSDVFVDRRLSAEAMRDPEVYGECLGGALYFEDFRRLLFQAGCPDFRIVESSSIEIQDPRIKGLVGSARFSSFTVRAFKLETLEDRCEDYGQFATYLGTMEECPEAFLLDDHHLFEAHRPMAVCGNTTAMIQETRYSSHFEIVGDRSRHFGLFDCGPSIPVSDPSSTPSCC